MKSLHIISFDVPYPANYGGVIDVFYKLKALHKLGVKITLHCFEYGRAPSKELDKYCETVHYYKRSTSFIHQLSTKPFIVKSRTSKKLIQNLLLDELPILFEGLHTCGIISDVRLKNRLKIYRESNIEHHYYKHLAKSEQSLFKKIYFLIEAIKLKTFEKTLKHADFMLVVSKADTTYLKNKFPTKEITYLPSFHPYTNMECLIGKGNYVLYHGNLSVSENYLAAEFLISNVFSKANFLFKIAGLQPNEKLKQLVKQHKNIELIANPTDEQLQVLIKNAHINCLYTHQETGLKLKLLNALFAGRFCLVNNKMLYGTNLSKSCVIADNSEDMKEKIANLFNHSFTQEEMEQREKNLAEFSVSKNAKFIFELI